VVFNPNGQTAYVMNSGSSPRSISIIDTTTNAVTGTINTTAAALSDPFTMAITPNGNYGYVSGGFYITVVDLLTNATTQNITLPVTDEVVSIAITPDGTTAYACLYGGQLYAIDLATNTIVATVTGTFSNGYGSAITPDGTTLYIANANLNSVSIVDIATNAQTGTVTDLNPATINFPFALALTPDGSTLYVVNDSGQSVSIVDTATNMVTGTVTDLNPPTFDGPIDMVVAPDGATGYVLSTSNNTISIVYITTPILPPNNFTGCTSQDVFLFQEDLINILSWNSPSGGTAPASYKIYSNTGLTQLVATVSASGPLQYIDHNRSANTIYSYYIVSIDAQSDVSSPASVTVTQSCS
jgi:YVTN family beta-propeller protein